MQLCSTFNEVDMSEVIAMRDRYKEDFRKIMELNSVLCLFL